MGREGIARPRHTAAFFPPEEGTKRKMGEIA